MKSYLLSCVLIFTFLTSSSVCSQHILFPDSFKSDPSLFSEMNYLKITQEITDESGIIQNSGVVSQPELMADIAENLATPHLTSVYYEVYEADDPERTIRDAGVLVLQYDTEENMKLVFLLLNQQENVIYLTVDNYLISVWSDYSKDREKRIDDLAKYYIDKLGAKIYLNRDDEGNVYGDQYDETTEN